MDTTSYPGNLALNAPQNMDKNAGFEDSTIGLNLCKCIAYSEGFPYDRLKMTPSM